MQPLNPQLTKGSIFSFWHLYKKEYGVVGYSDNKRTLLKDILSSGFIVASGLRPRPRGLARMSASVQGPTSRRRTPHSSRSPTECQPTYVIVARRQKRQEASWMALPCCGSTWICNVSPFVSSKSERRHIPSKQLPGSPNGPPRGPGNDLYDDRIPRNHQRCSSKLKQISNPEWKHATPSPDP